MKKVMFMVVTLFAGSAIMAQSQFSISVDAGIGKIKTLSLDNFPSLYGIESNFTGTYNATVAYGYKFKNISIETGVSYSSIKGEQLDKDQITNINDGSVSNINSIKVRQTHYIGLPIMVKAHINKFSIGLGVSFRYLITNSTQTSIYVNEQDDFKIQTGNDLAKPDFGFLSQIGFDINENFGIYTKMYIGLSDISNETEKGLMHDLFGFDNPLQEFFLKNRQFTIGIKYTFGSLKEV